jgi:hypothetical protein
VKFIHSITHAIILSAILLMPFIDAGEVKDQQALKNKMFADLEVIKNTFEVKYAPADWKFSFTRWDLEEEMNVAKAKVLSIPNITITDYQHIVKEFFKSAKDYHVEVNFYSTASAFLPFRIQRAEGKYFIVWVDASSRKMLHSGDEIIEFDGRPIHDVVTEFKLQEFGNPNSLTDQAFAEMFFTMRIGQMGHHIPQGSITIVTKPKGATKTASHQFTWIHTAEEILQEAFYPSILSACKTSKLEPAFAKISTFQNSAAKIIADSYLHKEMCLAQYNLIHVAFEQNKKNKDDNQSEEPDALGGKKSFVPALGKKIWETDPNGFFHAYLFKCHNKTIGYIRIPEYMGGSGAAEEFASLIRLFQKRSDALVIDQVNNPGGIILNMYALASMLTPYPLHLPTQRLTITQQDVSLALDVVSAFEEEEAEASTIRTAQSKDENIVGYPVDQKFTQEVMNHYNFIIKEWNAGRYFTEPCYLYGIESLHPHPSASYSKPILVLVNQLDFSCADFLPVILQDNKRATIFGTQTAGAGGILLSHSHPNRFGIASYSLTGSITMRKNNSLIENHGVTPDIIYELTQNDLQDNYTGYAAAVQRAINKIIKKK